MAGPPEAEIGSESQPRRPNWGLRLRLILMPAVIAALLVWKFWGDGARSAAPLPEAPVVRNATAMEWSQPIAELGRQRLAKQLCWLATTTSYGPGHAGPRRDDAPARGELVWWQDAAGEAVCYLPVAGEPADMGTRLMLAIHDGSAVLLDRHGDPALRGRLGDLPHDRTLPSGWTILAPP